MKGDHGQRWLHAYERAKARTRRRVAALVEYLERVRPADRDDMVLWLDRLVGDAAAFEDRVHAMLLAGGRS